MCKYFFKFLVIKKKLCYTLMVSKMIFGVFYETRTYIWGIFQDTDV